MKVKVKVKVRVYLDGLQNELLDHGVEEEGQAAAVAVQDEELGDERAQVGQQIGRYHLQHEHEQVRSQVLRSEREPQVARSAIAVWGVVFIC